MAYSTIDDLIDFKQKNQIIDLVNDESRPYNEIDLSNASDVCAIRIQQIIDTVDEEINASLRERYTLPLSSTPKLLFNFSLRMVYFYLYQRRHELDVPDSLQADMKRIRADLDKIQIGKKSLGIETTDYSTNKSEYKVNKTSSDKIFDKDTLDSY